MIEFFKLMYICWFTTCYYVIGMFIKQDDDHVVFIHSFHNHQVLIDQIPKDKIVTTVNPKNVSMFKQIVTLKRAKYVFVDNFYYGFTYINTDKKIIVQIWHANGAIKKFFLASPNSNSMYAKRLKRVYKSFDYVTVGSDIMEEIFKDSMQIKDTIFLKFGYMAMDLYFKDNYQDKVNKIKEKYKFNKKIVLYVPTFKNNKEDNKLQIHFVEYLKEKLSDEYELIYCLHPKVSEEACVKKEILKVQNSELPYIYPLCEYIITDYSAIIFEACLFNSTFIFFLEDFDKYQKQVGLNLTIDQLPGFVCKTENDVLNIIENRKTMEIPTEYSRWNKYTDGNCVKRLIEFIFKEE